MTPIGPYSSQWASKAFFIVRGTRGIVTVPNGEQASEGVLHLTVRDAKRHLADNGFTLKNAKQSGRDA